jgi:hypothetical protein
LNQCAHDKGADDAGPLKDPVCGMIAKPDSPHQHVHEDNLLLLLGAVPGSSAQTRGAI